MIDAFPPPLPAARRLAWGLLALCLLALPAPGALQPPAPDVLFIAVDDLNDYISPLDHHPGVRTPHLERLAARSVTFTRAQCAAPACHPSRVAVLTGVHPVRSGIYRNLFRAHGPRWRHESPVLRDAVVLSRHFMNHGYRAVGGGKLFHALQWTPGDSQNDPDAWTAYRGDPLNPIAPDWPRPPRTPDAQAGLGPGRPLGAAQLFGAQPLRVPDEETGDHRVVDWAIEQLHATRAQPLFLAVGLFRPHIPWEVPQRWFDLHPASAVALPATRTNDLADAFDHGRRSWHRWVTDNRQWTNFVRGYLASVAYMDHQVGRLLDALEASPRRTNTVVVLWSDHGFHLGEKENWEKFALWDQTTRVPLFIGAPGRAGNGKRCREAVSLVDLYPTLCELAGLPVPPQCTGRSLVPQLDQPTRPVPHPALISHVFNSADNPGRRPSHAVADARHRLIRYHNGFEELYDLEEDPNEYVNRAQDARLAEAKARLARHLPADPAPDRDIPTSRRTRPTTSPHKGSGSATGKGSRPGACRNRPRQARLPGVTPW
ncbi:MAG: hypothetical protein RJA22_2986 [Verrucomicrobiota bacterium]